MSQAVEPDAAIAADVGDEPAGTRIERSPADILRLVVAAVIVIVVLAIARIFGDTLVTFTSQLFSGLSAVPHWMIDVIVVGTRILGVVVIGGGLIWTLAHQRWRMLLTVAAAGALAAALVALFEAIGPDDEGSTLVHVGGGLGTLSGSEFPSTYGIGIVAGVVTAAAPWLSRAWRRAGWTLIVGLIVTRFLSAPVSFDSGLAALIGWFAGAAVLVVLGAPSRRPTMAAVAGGLADVGLALEHIEKAGVDARGSTPYFGTATDGSPLFVKALGEDERSADLLFRLYRRIQPRDFGDERPFSTLRRSVEHEALVALAAKDLGVRTPGLRAFATAEPNSYVLAYDAIAGKSLDRLDPTQVTDGVLGDIWHLLGQLREHRIAHRDLRLANVFLDDAGQVWLIDFGFSELAASDLLLATDVAELTASSSAYVGAERAVALAAATVDAATLGRARDRMQRWALSGATRSAMKAQPGLLDDLRARMAEAAGTTR